MRENLNPGLSWWKKIKSIFKRDPEIKGSLQLPPIIDLSADPFVYIDELQAMVSQLRSEFDLEQEQQWDLNLLAASTYLYHVERILVKIRENMLTIRYRTEQFKEQPEQINRIEFNQAHEAQSHCYIAIVNLIALLRKISIKQIYNDEVVNCIHALELESANLNTTIRALNQMSFRQETLSQLNALEQALKQTIAVSPADYVYSSQGVMYSTTELLRNQLKEVPLDDAKWLAVFVEMHDILKKCYVVARKSVIKELLDKMCDHIQNLIAAFNNASQNPDKEVVFNQLSFIFSSIESIRFNTHRESRCSKNLFEKAKFARQQLRKACRQHPIGREYLIRHAIKDTSLKTRMKSSL
ncbi:hypothetical protein [Candidatus Berkiella aquae]|uniref:Uncharacterized protein n=1 Tax=Candidatus Berkiella aquae TaxID=295108 RepID=A0A0Q9YPY2_9GAMM|nr:hypothetical protein [Candidatus Berkiella aquae]MCS5711059.1 hypothetical protein [Candidatus Berkiella aquae]